MNGRHSGKIVTVRHLDDDGWIVVAGTSQSGPYARKRDATREGREMLKEIGGGELLIHSRSGRITDRDSVGAKIAASSMGASDSPKKRSILDFIPGRHEDSTAH